METKLMQRIFTAINKGEDPILDQLETDLATAKDKGSLSTEEYDLRLQNDNSITIKDKVNNEVTRATYDYDGIKLNPVRVLIKGTPVSWIDNLGAKQVGTLVDVLGDYSKILFNGKLITVKTNILMNTQFTPTKSYSKHRASMFLVDERGNLKAYGWLSSLMALKKSNPNYRIITNYDWNALNNGLKNIKQFSDSLQKIFTRSTRRWAVIDKSMKLIGIFDVTNAKGLVKLNPGYTMMKEKDWNQRSQPKINQI